MLQRRAFLSFVAAAFVAPDLERLLWVPGAKTISIPKASAFRGLCWDDGTPFESGIAIRNYFRELYRPRRRAEEADGTPFESGIAIRNYFRELDRLNMLPKIGDKVSIVRPPRFVPWRAWTVGQDLFSITLTPDMARDLDLPVLDA